MQGVLVLADGRIFRGQLFGACKEVQGEVVFNTSMSGYQEILTDPSYCGQMVTMTYPLIGNYGINREDVESDRVWLSGFIIKELSAIPSNFRSTETLDDFLRAQNVTGFQGADTRALTRHIRDQGAQQGIISPDTENIDALRDRAGRLPSMEGQDLVSKVTCDKPYSWDESIWKLGSGYGQKNPPSSEKPFDVVAYDFGIKRNILRELIHAGCSVTVVSAHTPAKEVLDRQPDGVFLSNGPGDPSAVTYAIENVRQLVGKVPIFGICLGHQILSLALGGSTYKLRFGHHGGNQPVMDHRTQKVEITSQNHGFAVKPDSKTETSDILWTNLNDQTVEGLKHKTLPIFSVQYHPEASPGPHDSSYLFGNFVDMMKTS